MIERLVVKGFQAHDSCDLELSSGITTIVGPSDSGKSSAIRALKWVARNRPLGDGFVRFGCNRAYACAVVGGVRVKRVRSAFSNYYQVGRDGEKLVSFGSGVPPQVVDAVRMEDLNFSGQHDAPFWFNLSPSELARQLNRLIDLDLIDTSASEVASRLRRCRSEKDVLVERVASSESKMSDLEWVVEAGEDLSLVERLSELVSSKLAAISSLDESVRRMVAAKVSTAVVCPSAEEVAGVSALADEVEIFRRSVGVLSSLLSQAEESLSRVARSQKDVDGAKLEVEKEFHGRCPLCGSLLEEGRLDEGSDCNRRV